MEAMKEKYTSAILCLGAPPELAASVGAVLRAIPGFTCIDLRCSDPISTELDAIIFVATPARMQQLLERISTVRADHPGCVVLVLGAGFDAKQLSTLFATGIHDFVGLLDELAARLTRAFGLIPQALVPHRRTATVPAMRDVIGDSPRFAEQIAKLPLFASCDAGVLILGETGTGKEVCAQAIHYLSARSSNPWISVNCGAIPLELIESELFGHVRGAYTTATMSRQGLVAEAERGTLFLDDIDCLPVAAQSKLLHFLEEREYRVVGANAMRKADVRVIAASNCDLARMVERGEFRRDLYFRLNVLTLMMPPLRERQGDIPALAAHFVAQSSRRFGRPAQSLSPPSLKKLLTHNWPGNVRELQHVIERAALLACGPMISADDIDVPGGADNVAGEGSFRSAKERVVQEFERTYIERLLEVCEGNITHAALEAKKNRRAFFALMRKHGIEPQRFRGAK